MQRLGLGVADIFPAGSLCQGSSPGPGVQAPNILQACISDRNQDRAGGREVVRHGKAQGSHKGCKWPLVEAVKESWSRAPKGKIAGHPESQSLSEVPQ